MGSGYGVVIYLVWSTATELVARSGDIGCGHPRPFVVKSKPGHVQDVGQPPRWQRPRDRPQLARDEPRFDAVPDSTTKKPVRAW